MKRPKRTRRPFDHFTIRTGGRTVPGHPFMGETMNCVCCGRTGQSDPGIESNWRAIQLGGRTWYACPSEFPPDDSPRGAFAKAYTRVIAAVVEASKREGAL